MPDATITAVEVHDVRFPTAGTGDGSDAINRGDYSATYVELRTDVGVAGCGLTFTNGRGNELTCAAVRALAHHVRGRTVDELFADPVAFSRSITADAQLRWLGPEKGVIHMASGALINAVWDLRARLAGKPMWQLLAELSAEELVSTVDFRHLTDALTPEEALRLLERAAPGYEERLAVLRREGFPAYTTSVGWLGYPDEKVRALTREAVDAGWTAVKMKVGGPIEDDVRRAGIIREEIGPDRLLMMDANQVWDVDEAIANMRRLLVFDPYWIEEPTHADDVLGHARIARSIAELSAGRCRVATGDVAANRVIFKQLLAAGAIGVCHLHEHFTDPVLVRGGRYLLPTAPGYSMRLVPESVARFTYPDGPAWR